MTLPSLSLNNILRSDASYSNLISIELNAWNANVLIVSIFTVNSSSCQQMHIHVLCLSISSIEQMRSELKVKSQQKIMLVHAHCTFGKWMEWNVNAKKNTTIIYFSIQKKCIYDIRFGVMYHMYGYKSSPQRIEDEYSIYMYRYRHRYSLPIRFCNWMYQFLRAAPI